MASKASPRHLRVLRLSLVPLGWVAWIFTALALLSFHVSDPTYLASSPSYFSGHAHAMNWCGPVGATLAFLLMNYIGPGAWVAVIMLCCTLFVWTAGGNVTQMAFRLLGGAVLVAVGSGLTAMAGIGAQLPEGAGGLLGMGIAHFLTVKFSHVGSMLILLLGLTIGLLLAADEILLAVPAVMMAGWGRLPRKKIAKKSNQAAGAAWEITTAMVAKLFNWLFTRPAKGKKKGDKLDPMRSLVKMAPRPAVSIKAPVDSGTGTAVEEAILPPIPAPSPPVLPPEEAAKESEAKGEQGEAAEPAELPRAEPVVRRPRASAEPLLPFKAPPPQKQDLGNYRLPDIDLLTEPEPSNTEGQEQRVREKARVLEESLHHFGVQAKVVAIDTGPVVTLYELELDPGVKSSAVVRLSKDISRALMSPPVRCIDNITGKATMGIEVPNMDRDQVRLKELMQLGHQPLSQMALPMCLGKDVSGNPLIEDLTKMPHLLIAGTTGSGKSVCINSIIMTLLLTQRPDHVKLIMIDPKIVEMQDYRDIPHLMTPIIDDMGKAESVLEWATQKMDERYETLSTGGVRHIRDYNKLSREEIIRKFEPTSPEEEARLPFHLPYIVIIIDELADLMMTSKEVEGHIVRIAQKARAVGIHLILATQRPEAQVVTGLIKSNMPGRICFQVRARIDSRIMLDQSGGELLLGQGDMLMLKPTGGNLLRGQGTYVDDSEIKHVCAFLRDIAQPEFHPELMQLGAPTGLTEAEKDPMFDDAVKIIVESRRGSVSLLQHRLAIGYSRASRLVDQMRAAGIVGAYKGSQASDVLISMEDWESMKAANLAADREDAAKAELQARATVPEDRPADEDTGG